jgi:hypothetical protein
MKIHVLIWILQEKGKKVQGNSEISKEITWPSRPDFWSTVSSHISIKWTMTFSLVLQEKWSTFQEIRKARRTKY